MKYALVFGVGLVLVAPVSCGVDPRAQDMRTDASSEGASATEVGRSFAATSTETQVQIPPTPSDLPDLVGYSGTAWTHDQLPPLRMSADGRIAVAMKSGTNQIRVHLLSPERMTRPFGESDGVNILQLAPSGSVLSKILKIETEIETLAPGLETNHLSICDEAGTPRVCGTSDCYDLIVVGSLTESAGTQKRNRLISIPVTVRVDLPKTAAATIGEVALTPLKKINVSSKDIPVSSIFEPMAVGDGRLLIARLEGSPLSWIDAAGNARTGEYDVVYSSYQGGDACDASQWTQLSPITHAPYDAAVRARYDFARQAFKDAKGQTIPDGQEIGITYPWIDPEAKNLVFTTQKASLFKTEVLSDGTSVVRSRFPVCLPDTCLDGIPKATDLLSIEESRGNTRGFAIMGAWTRGRLVLMDNLLNRADFGLKSQPAAFRDVQLYRDGSTPRYIRVGANRDNVAIPGLPGFVGNTTFFESITDRFAYSDKFKPRLARDVTWTVSNGIMTDELAFDDFLDLDTVLFADMNAVVGLFPGSTEVQYRNGEDDAALLQNAASGGPAYGRLVGKARIEPVALGGRFGKGVYLGRVDAMKFAFPSEITSDTQYIGLFVRPDAYSGRQRLLSFAEGATIDVVPGEGLKISFMLSTGVMAERTVALNAQSIVGNAWVHLGFLLEPDADGAYVVSTFVNGMAMSRSAFSNRPFRIASGDLTVGGGLAGWYDEVRVAKAAPSPEEACNYAYGTLAQIEDAALASSPSNPWVVRAALYPASAHARVRQALTQANVAVASTSRFVCLIDHKAKYGWAPSRQLPDGVYRYLRQPLLMMGTEFHAAEPRPEAGANSFCLSCHSETSRIPGLKRIKPLMLIPDLPMQDDERKQPTQPLRVVTGIIPAGLFGANPDSKVPVSSFKFLFP